MIDPLVVEFTVDAGPDHAFSVWVSKASLWWPRSKTVSDESLADVVFEPFVGGRIYERDRTGAEHDWGTVVRWDPPERIDFTWHLFFDPAEATDVSITFRPREGGTAVRLEQRGWERLGAAGPVRRDRTRTAWGLITPPYATAVSDPI